MNIKNQKATHPLTGSLIDALGLSTGLIVFDLETSALLKQHNSGIIELCALKVNQKGDTRCITSLVNPEAPLSAYSSNLTGITNEMVASAPNWPDLLKLTKTKWMEATLCGFGVNRFDIPYLVSQNHRYHLPCAVSKKSIDIRTLCQKIHKTNKGTLIHYVSEYGITPRTAHRAEDDTVMTADLLEAMLRAHGIDLISSLIVAQFN